MKHATVRFQRPVEGTGAPSRSADSLPTDILEQSRFRIRIMALLVLLGSGADSVLIIAAGTAWLFGTSTDSGLNLFSSLGNGLTVASALGVLIAAGRARVSTRTLLSVALAFEVFLCLVLSLSNPVSVYDDTGALPTLTWVTPLIILFPLIVPCSPRRTLITAILAASTRPLGILVLAASGRIDAGADALASASFSPVLAVVFAYFGSRVVYGMGVAVAQARQMGNYALERELGRGGMGEVWLGRHTLLARPAAVKLIRSDTVGDGAQAQVLLARFEREAQATATLRSPHTVSLYDFGVNDEGVFYYVMELLDGMDADTLVTRFGPVPSERAIFLLRQVCHSLAEAHETHLIHRDIKPANVYLCRYGRDFDFVKVLDFGLVKTPADVAQSTVLTADDVVRGTPAFMAPEQAKSDKDVDARTDVYAVGCLAYWLITGELVFARGSAIEMLIDHVQTQPTPPSERTELAVSPDLERVVMACLAKDPAERPQSATELSSMLADCATEEEWPPERARSWWETHQPETSPD